MLLTIFNNFQQGVRNTKTSIVNSLTNYQNIQTPKTGLLLLILNIESVLKPDYIHLLNLNIWQSYISPYLWKQYFKKRRHFIDNYVDIQAKVFQLKFYGKSSPFKITKISGFKLFIFAILRRVWNFIGRKYRSYV